MRPRLLLWRLAVFFALAAASLACRFAEQWINPAAPTTQTVVETVIVERWITATPPAALTPTSPAPTATAVEAAAAEEASATATPTLNLAAARRGIQQAIDLYAQAFRQNDPDLLQQVVDQENKPFRRLVNSRFTELQSSFLGGFDLRLRLSQLEVRPHGFVLAHFRDRAGVGASWLFRQLGDGRWVLSEPTVEQIGEPVTLESDHFTFKTYPWADDVNAEIMRLMETAYQQVQERLGKTPETKALVEIAPIYGLKPYTTMMAVAYYQASSPTEPDTIYIYSPHSYAYGFYSLESGWQGELQTVLTHEYVHMTHRLAFDEAGKLAVWVSEGLAEYISQPAEGYWLACNALRSGDLIPILDQESQVYKQDLMHMNNLEKDTALAYHEAHALVAFIVENYGGLEGFWALVQAFDKSQDLDQALRDQLGISYQTFNQRWLDWLKKQCSSGRN